MNQFKVICVFHLHFYPVYDNERENWRILTNEEIYTVVKKPTITETVSLIVALGIFVESF